MKIAVWNKDGVKSLHTHAVDAKEAIATGNWFAHNPKEPPPPPPPDEIKVVGPAEGIAPVKAEEPAPKPVVEDDEAKPEIERKKKRQ